MKCYNWSVIRELERVRLGAASLVADGRLIWCGRTGGPSTFAPPTELGLGGGDFSWTATLVVDLLHRPIAQEQ